MVETIPEINEPIVEPFALTLFKVLRPWRIIFCPVLMVPFTLLAVFVDLSPLTILFFPLFIDLLAEATAFLVFFV